MAAAPTARRAAARARGRPLELFYDLAVVALVAQAARRHSVAPASPTGWREPHPPGGDQGRATMTMLNGSKATRETAAAPFLSPKAVEYHLRHVYQKLAIHSREELAQALADDGT